MEHEECMMKERGMHIAYYIILHLTALTDQIRLLQTPIE